MIRYLARTTFGFWSFLGALVLVVVNTAQRGEQWVGDALLTADAQGLPPTIIGPLLAAVAAVDAARLSTRGRRHLVRLAPRLRHPYVAAALATWLPVAAVQVGAGAWALAHFAPGTIGTPAGIQAMVAVTTVALGSLLFVSLGSAIGRYLPQVAAGLVASGVAFALLVMSIGSSGAFRLLDFGGATVTRIGFAYAPTYLL